MQIFLVALAGLAVLVLAAVFSRRTGIAAPLLLLGLGVVAGLSPALPNVEIEPEIVLAGVLPPLLYSSSTQMPVVDLRRNLRMIAWLSVVMVLVTAVVIGGVVHLAFPQIPFALGVALGAVVSPTDAVAATAIGKRLGLPHRLMTILEGESLFNDAAALVTLRTAVAALAASFSFWEAAGRFTWATAGGIAVGILVGIAAVAVRARLGDPVLTTTVSFVVPWVAFFPAEEIGASGIIAVVIAGVVAGHRGRTRLSATERATEATTWSSVNFLLENALFLVMGLQITPLLEDSRADGGFDHLVSLCLLVFALMVVLRVAGVAVPLLWQRVRPDRATRLRDRLSMKTERVRELAEDERIAADRLADWQRRLDAEQADIDFETKEPITRRGGVVLAWAGMRGAVTLAAAQTIAVGTGAGPTPYRSTVVLTAFLVAAASLAVFGGTLPWVIRRLRFEASSSSENRAELIALMQDIGTEATDTLGPLSEQTLDGKPLDPAVVAVVKERFGALAARAQTEHAQERPRQEPGARQQAMAVQRRYLDEMRTALAHAQLVGAYSAQTLAQAQDILDAQEQRIDAMS